MDNLKAICPLCKKGEVNVVDQGDRYQLECTEGCDGNEIARAIGFDVRLLDKSAPEEDIRAARDRVMREMIGPNFDADLAEVSPALHFAKNLMQAHQREEAEAGMLRIANMKRPTWAGARGFNESYARCVERAIEVKKSPRTLDEFDGLTQLHVFAGACMADTPCVTIGTDQILSLPNMSYREQMDFTRNIHLPFKSGVFFDFARSNNDLPSFTSDISKNGFVGCCGALVKSWNEGASLLVTPFFVYNDEHLRDPRVTPTPLGLTFFQVDPDAHRFSWGDRYYDFEEDSLQVLVAHTEVLDDPKYAGLGGEYRNIIALASELALRVLYFMESANVEEVPVPMEKRDAKRAEKRGWRIPDTVRVSRPKRRSSANQGESNGVERTYTHQWTVRGFYRHVQKGSHVRCQVCKGEPHEELGCSACNNTGLDMEKVKPCLRLFEEGPHKGQPTCPHGCRREWTPDHVRGPEDLPLVMKTYDIKAA